TPRFGAALALPQIYCGANDVAGWRTRYGEGLARLERELPEFLEIPDALWQLDWSNFYLAYQGSDDLEFQTRYANLMSAMAAAAAPDWRLAPDPLPRGTRRLRVGFASSFLHQCTVSTYFASWMTGLDRNCCEVVVVYFG